MARNEAKMEAKEDGRIEGDQRNNQASARAMERLKAYRQHLKARGKLKEAEAVQRCIEIVKSSPQALSRVLS